MTTLLEDCRSAMAEEDWGSLRECSQALLLEEPDLPEAHYLHGLARYRCLEMAAAEESLCRAIYLAREIPASYVCLTQLLVCDKRFDLAREIVDEAVKNCAPTPDWLTKLVEPVNTFDPGVALDLIDRALEIEAENPAAACKKLELLQAAGDEVAAGRFLENYCSTFGSHPNSRVLRAIQAQHMGDRTLALEIYKDLMAEYPDDEGIRFNLGRLYGEQGDQDSQLQALAPYLTCSSGFPAAEILLAYALFARRQFKEAFRLYERRDKVGWRPVAPIPRASKWDGSPLTGKRILIVYEQGYGDVLMGSRYVSALKKKADQEGAKAIGMLCHHQLYSFFAHSRSCKDIALHLEMPAPGSYDCHIPLLSIPVRLEQDIQHPIPHQADFETPSFLKKKWSQILGKTEKARVGIVWKSISSALNAQEKSLPEADFLALLHKTPSIEWIVFAPGIANPDVPELRDLSPHVQDFADTAALMEQLDAVVSVDTGPAHLAGCLEIPQILLSQFQPDWRWAHDTRGFSLWYPTTSVITQARRGDWSSAVDPAVKALIRRLQQHP